MKAYFFGETMDIYIYGIPFSVAIEKVLSSYMLIQLKRYLSIIIISIFQFFNIKFLNKLFMFIIFMIAFRITCFDKLLLSNLWIVY